MKTQSGKEISKIGIGSYGIGGRGHRDMEITEKADDKKYIGALIYTLQKGINFTEIALGYGHGQSLTLFKQAFDGSGVNRNDFFLTHSLYPRDLETVKVAKEDIDNFYKIMGTDFADSTLVTQSMIIKFGEKAVYRILTDLLETGRTRFVSLSNASPAWIKKYKSEFGDKFIAHEGHLSFEVRALQDKGVFQTCDDLHVKNIIWRPLRRNKTLQHNWELLSRLSSKYEKTPSQVILNWMCYLGYSPMVFSTSPEHIDENLESTGFTMTNDEYLQMTNFRPANYNEPKIDWEGPNIDDDIVEQSNNFENYIQQ